MSYISTAGAAGGSGTVTSVGQTINSGASSGIFTVTGSPVTTAGTLDIATAGTSGGVPYFSSGTVISSSAALTSNALVLGGGAAAAPKVSTGLTTNGASELDVGVAGGATGVLGLNGSTSGKYTLTASATGTLLTANNALTLSAGSMTLGAAGQSFVMPTGGFLQWVGQSRIGNAADGVITLFNQGLTGFTRLNFGGTTSSFVALGSSATTLTLGLADGTAGGSLALGGLVTKYNNINTVSNGQPAEYATVDLTAQTAAIGATTLYAVPAGGAGMYRISWSATITTAASVSSVLGGTNGFQILYTSPTDSVVKTTVSGNSVTSAANTTATAVGGVEIVYAKLSTNIQYQYDYTSSGTAMAYELHLKIEAL